MQQGTTFRNPSPSGHELVEHFTRALEEAGVEIASEQEYEVQYEALDGLQRMDAIIRLRDDPRTISTCSRMNVAGTRSLRKSSGNAC